MYAQIGSTLVETEDGDVHMSKVCVCDMTTGKRLRDIHADQDCIHSLKWSPNGKFIAIVGDE